MKFIQQQLSKGTLYTLTVSERFSIRLTSFGAAVRDITFFGKKMTCAPKEDEAFLMAPDNYGKTVGPIAGRVRSAAFEVDGKTYRLPASPGPHCLHSGDLNFAYREFEAEIKESEDEISVVFHTFFPKKEGVYPADLGASVEYRVKRNEDRLYYKALVIPSSKAPISLVNHMYFNLGEKEDILSHTLFIDGEEVNAYDRDMIVTGKEKASLVLSFASPHRIGDHIEDPLLQNTLLKGYDHAYHFAKTGIEKANLILESEDFALKLYTDAPAVQAYTTNYPHDNFPLDNGFLEKKYSSIALEPCLDTSDFNNLYIDPKKPYEINAIYAFLDKRPLR